MDTTKLQIALCLGANWRLLLWSWIMKDMSHTPNAYSSTQTTSSIQVCFNFEGAHSAAQLVKVDALSEYLFHL